MARLASHELEGAVDEGARVAEGGAVVVHHHNVEQLRRRHGAVAGGRRRKGRWRPWFPFPFSPCSGPLRSVGFVLKSDSVGQPACFRRLLDLGPFSCRVTRQLRF